MRSCTRSTTLVLIHLLTLTHLTFAEPTHTILVSTAVPSNTSPHIDTSFLGFAFEQASFYNYSFDSQGAPNTFSQNLIQSVLDRTGVRPLIRVGGTSGDHAHFNASQDTATQLSSYRVWSPLSRSISEHRSQILSRIQELSRSKVRVSSTVESMGGWAAHV